MILHRKYFLFLFNFIFLSFALFSHSAQAQLNVFACEPEWAALAKQLGGDKLNIFTATTAQQDPHHIQARPSLIAKVRRAHILICSGADLEIGWLPLLLRKSGNPAVQPGQSGYFMAADQVGLLEKPSTLDRSQGDIHAAGNPHVQLDPRRMAKIASALKDRLIQIDPKSSTYYQQRYKDFHHEWNNALERWQQQAQPIRGKSIIVYHNSWVYLEDWLGLKRLATLEPKPGIAPSTAHLSQVLETIKRESADFLIYSKYKNAKAVNWLNEKTNIKTHSLPLTVETDQTLIEWFDQIILSLRE